jgi:hypothetical protein
VSRPLDPPTERSPRPERLAIGDPRYPVRLLDLADPPGALRAAGDVALLVLPAVAILGSGSAPASRLEQAARLARAARAAGLAVVAGDSTPLERAVLESARDGGVCIRAEAWGGGPQGGRGTMGAGRRASDRGAALVAWEDPADQVVDPGESRAGMPGGLLAAAGRRRRARSRARGIQVALAQAVLITATARESEVMHAAGWAGLLGRPLFAVGPDIADAAGADDRLGGLAELVRTGAALALTEHEAAAFLERLAAPTDG